MSQENRKKISQNVKKYREKANLTREDLSLKLGLDNSYISKLEACRINITIDQLSSIANILGVDVKDLLQ